MNSIKAGLLNSASQVPMSAALYFVYALWARGEVIYVGYTNSLPQRILAHTKAAWGDYEGYTYVSFNTKREALDIERALIQELRPKLNVNKAARRNWVSPAELDARPLTPAQIANMDPVIRESLRGHL